MPQTEFHKAVKALTAEVHEQLEASPIARNVMSDRLQPADYLRYLVATCYLHRLVEQEVFPLLGDIIPNLEERIKAHLLKKELEALGLAQLPHYSDELDARAKADKDFCLGMLYVTEGSTMGNLLIAKHVQQTMDISNGFLVSYGKTAPALWRDFLNIFNQYTDTLTPARKTAVSDGALYGFARASAIFNYEYELP